MQTTTEKEMVDGYIAGHGDDRLELPDGHNFSVAYAFGWLNGRDDRVGTPRERNEILRARAAMILGVVK